MATVAELIRSTFRLIGVLADGETPTAAQEAHALTSLNDMLDSWAGERQVLFSTLRSTHTLTPSLSPHTMGDGGTFDTTRPVRIDRASIVGAGSNTERPIDLLSDSEWQEVGDKSATGSPSALWVDTAHPAIGLHLWPIPSAADTLVLYSWRQIGRFTATSDVVDFPPGYARCVRYNLAIELAPEYGVAVSGEVANIASESKTILKRLNHKPGYLSGDPALSGRGHSNIETG